jgi:hypothetical protein
MREVQNIGNAGYANNRKLHGACMTMEFGFSVAASFIPVSRPFHTAGPCINQFSHSAVPPQTWKPSSPSSSSSSNSYRQRHVRFPRQSRWQFQYANVHCQPGNTAERGILSSRSVVFAMLSSLEKVHLIERGKNNEDLR